MLLSLLFFKLPSPTSTTPSQKRFLGFDPFQCRTYSINSLNIFLNNILM